MGHHPSGCELDHFNIQPASESDPHWHKQLPAGATRIYVRAPGISITEARELIRQRVGLDLGERYFSLETQGFKVGITIDATAWLVEGYLRDAFFCGKPVQCIFRKNEMCDGDLVIR